MGTAGKMARAQEAVEKAGTLAEAKTVLAQLIAEEEEVTDIFYTQEFTIEKLTDLLQMQDKDPVYIRPAAPRPAAKNYLLYIGIGIVILYFTGRIKL